MERCYLIFRFFVAGTFLLSLMSPSRATAGDLAIPKPQKGEFVRDLADLLSEEAELRIQQLVQQQVATTGRPIIVVTVESMAAHGGEGLTIESFAKQFLKEWFGAERGKGSQSEWPGVLLLVCRDDRQALIEPGDDWWAKNHTKFRRIMDNQIIAEFKSGRFETGMVEVVESLNHIAQRKDLLKALLPDFSRLGPKERFSLVFGLFFLLIWFLYPRQPLPADDSDGDSVDSDGDGDD